MVRRRDDVGFVCEFSFLRSSHHIEDDALCTELPLHALMDAHSQEQARRSGEKCVFSRRCDVGIRCDASMIPSRHHIENDALHADFSCLPFTHDTFLRTWHASWRAYARALKVGVVTSWPWV